MKVRIKVPANVKQEKHIEEIMLWSIDTEINCEFYTMHVEYFQRPQPTNRWAVWSIEPQDYIMFVLMWGGYGYKKKKGETNEENS
jgi:hypothetical protein